MRRCATSRANQMIVQVDLSSNDAACSPSQTEGAKADVKTDKEGDDEPVKEGRRPVYKATDIRGTAAQ